jgi:hypothetical protein
LRYTECYSSAVKFKTLQESLGKIHRARIDAWKTTGLYLAAQTGFRQAHISNFLNRKRGLSTEGVDKVLSVQRLSVLDPMRSTGGPVFAFPETTNLKTS